MAALHEAGGVPPGWKFTPPPGNPSEGRKAFAELGCYTCHVVQGESFPPPAPGEPAVGPELSGMGTHHPPEYFVESILNPDAVLVDGPGYIGTDGRSIMPTYPDMSVAELEDVVAYISSLTSGGQVHKGHHHIPPRVMLGDRPPDDQTPQPVLPEPPAREAAKFLVRIYDVRKERLSDFQAWFKEEGRQRLLAYPGLRRVETFVDQTCAGPSLVTIFSFENEPALDRFLRNPDAADIHERLNDFVVTQDDYVFSSVPLYKVDSLSAP